MVWHVLFFNIFLGTASFSPLSPFDLIFYEMDGVLETLPTVSKVHYGETLDIPWQMWSHLFSALMYFTNNIKCSTFNEDCLFSQNIMTLTLLLRLNYLKLHWTLIKLNLAAELYLFLFFYLSKMNYFFGLKTGLFIQVFIATLIFCFQITCFHEPCYVSKLICNQN